MDIIHPQKDIWGYEPSGYVELVKKMLGEYATPEFMEWLTSTGYFEAPSSKGHHGAVKYGLVAHSIEVARMLRLLTERLKLEWERDKSPEIVGLLHDMCKTDDYIWDWKNNDKIEWNKNQTIVGHGDKSIKILDGHFILTKEETDCILYHMGAFVDTTKWGDYSGAVRENVNVLMTHTADMLASQVIGI